MHKIEISDDTAEAIFRDILIQDFKGIIASVRELEGRLQELESYELEDLHDNRRYAEALKVMMGYYLAHDEAERVINETASCQ